MHESGRYRLQSLENYLSEASERVIVSAPSEVFACTPNSALSSSIQDGTSDR